MVALAPFLRRRPDGCPRLMGILNLTPDSFHADSRIPLDKVLEVASEMLDDGADWLDVGGESTRPGAAPVPPAEEAARVVPAIVALRERFPEARLSIDTRRPEVARAALDAGADMVNDVSGLRDPAMFDLVVERGCAVCIMHMQGEPGDMQAEPTYADVRVEVTTALHGVAARLIAAGHPSDLISLDPGIGFGKTLEHNLDLLRQRNSSDYSILWGVSRKSMFRDLLGREASGERLAGTLGVAAHGMAEGVDILRVHDVRAHADLLATLAALREVGA